MKRRAPRKGPTRSMVAGRDRIRTPVRCVKIVRGAQCGYRCTLPKQPAEYVRRPPKCPKCKTPFTYIDFHRIKREWKVKPCRCMGYHFPHARGRGYCEHNHRLTAEDLRRRWEGGP